MASEGFWNLFQQDLLILPPTVPPTGDMVFKHMNLIQTRRISSFKAPETSLLVLYLGVHNINLNLLGTVSHSILLFKKDHKNQKWRRPSSSLCIPFDGSASASPWTLVSQPCRFSCGVLDPFGSLIPESSTRYPKLRLMFLDDTSQETVILGSCLQAQQSIVNSARGWLSHLGWGHWLPIPQSLVHLYPCASCRQDKFGVESFLGGLMPPPST